MTTNDSIKRILELSRGGSSLIYNLENKDRYTLTAIEINFLISSFRLDKKFNLLKDTQFQDFLKNKLIQLRSRVIIKNSFVTIQNLINKLKN